MSQFQLNEKSGGGSFGPNSALGGGGGGGGGGGIDAVALMSGEIDSVKRYDVTGMFHWCESRGIEKCVWVSLLSKYLKLFV